MKRPTSLLIKTILALFFSVQSFSYENPISTLTIDSGYFQDSSRAFWTFGQEVDGLVATGFDSINSTFMGDFFLTRLLLGGVFYWQWNKLEYGYFVANHELGHGARFRAVGGTPIYHWQDEPWLNDIFSFWVKGFSRYNQGAQATSSTTLSSANYPTDFNLMVAAAGMNNSAQYAEFIEDQISYKGGGHILQYIGYIRAKHDASEYYKRTDGGQSGDIANVLSEYSAKGYSISADELRTGSIISRWASSTHWLFIASAFKYLVHGDPTVNPFFISHLRLPDISHFMTSRGVSYKVRSGYKSDTAFFPFSLEYVYNGEKTLEAAFGLRSAKNSKSKGMGLEFSANSKSGLGASADIALMQTERFNLTVGSSFYSRNSLLGERVLGKYLQGASGGYEVWGSLSFDY